MRELGQFLIYLAGTACLFVGIVAGANFLLAEYETRTSRDAPPGAIAAETEPVLATARTQSAPSNHPVWIAPTAKYDHTPSNAASAAAKREAASSKAAATTARKPSRQRSSRAPSIRFDDGRVVYGYAEPPHHVVPLW